MWKLKNRHNNKGFTIVELAVTMGIIATLSGIGAIGFSKINATNQQTQCINNLREISQGLQMYRNDLRTFPEDGYPVDTNDQPLSTELAGYIKTKSVFVCPADEDIASSSNYESYDPYYVARAGSYQNEELVIGCPRHSNDSKSTSMFTMGSTEITSIGAVQATRSGEEQTIPPDGTTAQRTIDKVNDVMDFADGSTIQIINAAGGGVTCYLVQSVRLADGTLYSIVRVEDNGTIDVNVNQGSKFEIVTPSAIVGVRGTEFTVQTSNGGKTTEVNLTDGTVILMDRVTGEITTLTAPGGLTEASIVLNEHPHYHWHANGTYHTHEHSALNMAHHGNPTLALKVASDAGGFDGDGDGFSALADCNDNDPNIYPGATEIHDNGKDDDCDPVTLDSSVYQALVDSINQTTPLLNSSDLKSALEAASPLSSDVLLAAINRETPMDTSDLKAVLLNESELTENVLLAAINRETPMNTSDLKDVLLDESPLTADVLQAAIDRNPPMDSGDLQSVLDAQ